MVLKGLIASGPATVHGGGAPNDSFAAGLQRVANRPIVCHALNKLRDAGVREVALVVPGETIAEVEACIAAEGPSELVSRCFAYEHDELPAALAGAIDSVGEAPCIVHPPDGLLARPLTSIVEMLSAGSPDLVVLVRKGSADIDSIGLATRRLLRLAEDTSPPGAVQGPSGICLFGPSGLRRAREAGWRTESEPALVTVAERLVEDGGSVRVEYVDGWFRCTGKSADLLEMNRIALDELGSQSEPIQGSENRIEGAVVVHPSACVESSVIIGPAIVGPGALVVESYIGPYTSIGAGAHIEGAEVERSIILAGASIMHVGGRLVASVVGRDARVARDFSLPRAMRLTVGDGGEVVLC
jgi:glucose-1-phosphate thymidylyltransferase